MLIHAASSCSIARALAHCKRVCDFTQHGMCVAVPSKVAVVPALLWFIYLLHLCCVCRWAFSFGEGVYFSSEVITAKRHWAQVQHCPALRTLQPCRICAPPCSPYACASILRLARPARLRSGGAHAVCMCCAQACDVAQARVQGGGLGVWDAAGEGWYGEGSQCTCASANELHVNSRNLVCAACAVRPVWPTAV